MSKIIIGNALTGDPALPLDQRIGAQVGFDVPLLLAGRLLVTADSGGGKSWVARVLFEQAFGKVQTIIIDPEGEFASLREKFPFVLAAKNGDTPIDIRSAGMLAHRLLKLRASAICDLYELKADLRHIWVRDFFNALIEAPKELRTPLIIAVDEFHIFAPEKGQGESEALAASIDVATRGRKRGICLAGITQRLAMLNKNVTSQLQNRLVGPTFEEVNIKTAVRLLGIAPGTEEREFHREIQLLEPGYFWAFGRAISRERILIKIRGVETTHPKAFEKHTAPLPPTPEKIKALLPQLADLPKEAEAKAMTEAEYKKRIRELEQQVSSSKREITAFETRKEVQSASVAIDQKVIDRATTRAVKAATAPLVKGLHEFQRLAKKIAASMFDATDALQKLSNAELPQEEVPSPIASPAMPIHAPVAVPRIAGRPVSVPMNGNSETSDLGNTPRRMLRGLAEFEAIGVESPTRGALSSWCGIKATTGTFRNYVSELRTRRLVVDVPGDRLKLTDGGRELAGAVEVPANTKELLARSKQIFGNTPGRMLEFIHGQGKSGVTRQAVAEHVGISHETGTFRNYLSELRSASMITDLDRETVKCAEWMFL